MKYKVVQIALHDVSRENFIRLKPVMAGVKEFVDPFCFMTGTIIVDERLEITLFYTPEREGKNGA